MPGHSARAVLLAAVVALSAGCATSPDDAAAPASPYLLVLGTAQDGGFPQIGSDHPRARAAWRDPALRRRVASLMIVDPRTGSRWLIDATPDLPRQIEAARGHPSTRSLPGPRPPLVDGIFLTHAHMGHYAGLVHLGREAYDARGVPVHASERMAAFLRTNAPWELLVRLGNIVLQPLASDVPIALAPDLQVTPFSVPHRAEYTDTFGFRVQGPSRSVLYIPDIDKWHLWDRRLEDELARVDVALVDGTFFGEGEVPGRNLSEIPHPFIVETLRRLAPLPATEKAKVRFTHLNHTNPALDPASPERRRLASQGFAVAEDGDVIPL